MYLDALSFKKGYTYTISFHTQINDGVTAKAKILSVLGDNPYTAEGIFSKTAEKGNGFVKQELTFTVTSGDITQGILLFTFESKNGTAETWNYLDSISITYTFNKVG